MHKTKQNKQISATDKLRETAYVSVPVTGLSTGDQSVPYVTSSMPRKVEATLLKDKLQKAQMSCNKLHT